MNKRAVLILVAVIVAVVVGVVGYQRLLGGDDATVAAAETVQVRRGTLEDSVGGTGSLVAAEEVEIAFTSGGRVAEVLVAEGDLVEEDQPLAVLDTRELTLSLESAESNLDAALSSLATAQSALSEVEAGADENEIAIAKVQVDQANDKLWGAQASRDGVCGRVEAGRGADYECDSAEASVLQAQDGARIAELQYDELLAGASDQELTSASDKIAQSRSQVASAETSLGHARLRLEQATLVSPMAGTVTALNVQAGEMASSGQPSATVSTVEELEVVVSLDETDVATVAVGMPAIVTLDSFPDDELDGTVTYIAPTAQTQSGVVLFPVTVALDSSDVAARPGMTAEVDIMRLMVEDTLIVPLRAIVSTPRGDFVALHDPDADPAAAGEAAAGAFADGQGNGGSFAADLTADGGVPEGMRFAEGGQGPGGGQFSEGMGRPEGMELPEGMSREDFRAMREQALEGGAGGFAAPLSTSGIVMVPVTIGVTTDSEVEILSGVEEGDVLVVPGSGTESDTGGPGMFPMGGMLRGGR